MVSITLANFVTKRESPKRTIFDSGGSRSELLQRGQYVPIRTLDPKGVDLVAVPHRLEKEMSASEDTGLRRRVDCDVPNWLWRRTKHPLYRCGKPSSRRRVLKPCGETRKEKSKEDNIW